MAEKVPDETRNALLLGVMHETYPRIRQINRILKQAGFTPIPVCRPTVPGSLLKRNALLLFNGLRARRNVRVVILPCLSNQYAPAAYLLSRILRVPLVSDVFVGLYETNVGDLGEIDADSVRAKLYRLVDRMAVSCGSGFLSDTKVRTAHFAGLAKSTAASWTLYVGAPEWAQEIPPAVFREEPKFLFYGNFLPLHGVPLLIRAWDRFKREGGPGQLEIIGSGGEENKALGVARELNPAALRFHPSVPESELVSRIIESNIVLGIFGESEKAASVIPNKVWQGLVSGRCVVTRSSIAYEEIDGLGELSDMVTCKPNVSSVVAALHESVLRQRECGGTARAPLVRLLQENERNVAASLRRHLGE